MHILRNAGAAAPSLAALDLTVPKESPQAAETVKGADVQGSQSLHSPAAIGLVQGSCAGRVDAKTRATLVAQAALKGVQLIIADDDAGRPLFIASRWSLTRQMHTPAEVVEFLARMPAGGRK